MRFRFLLIPILLLACQNPEERKAKRDEHRIYTSDQARIFFTNVRSIYYQKEVKAESKINFWRYKERDLSLDYPVLNLCIAEAWDRNEAYLLLEPNEYFTNKDTFTLEWVDKRNKSKGSFNFIRKRPTDDYIFARRIYPYLNKNFEWRYEGTVLFDEPRSKIFKKTYGDFQNLVAEK